MTGEFARSGEGMEIQRPSGTTWSELLRTIVRRYGYGTILIGSLLALWWGVAGPYPIQYVSNALYIVMIFVILGLELWIPFTKTWGDTRRATRADVVYFLLAAPIDALQIFILSALSPKPPPTTNYTRLSKTCPKTATIFLH